MGMLRRKKGQRLKILEKNVKVLFIYEGRVAYIDSIEIGVEVETYKVKRKYFGYKSKKFAKLAPSVVNIRYGECLVEGESFAIAQSYPIYDLAVRIEYFKLEYLNLKKDFDNIKHIKLK